jgi:hypothetical protein
VFSRYRYRYRSNGISDITSRGDAAVWVQELGCVTVSRMLGFGAYGLGGVRPFAVRSFVLVFSY